MNFAFKHTYKLYERPPTPSSSVLLHKQGALPLHCVSLGDKKIWKDKNKNSGDTKKSGKTKTETLDREKTKTKTKYFPA